MYKSIEVGFCFTVLSRKELVKVLAITQQGGILKSFERAPAFFSLSFNPPPLSLLPFRIGGLGVEVWTI